MEKFTKLVIVGNGFDLAHGLPTGYSDFMANIASSIIRKQVLSRGYRYEPIGKQCGDHSNYYHKLTNNEEDPWIGMSKNNDAPQFEVNPHSEVSSVYFQKLFQEFQMSGFWSDLETHYFNLLKTFGLMRTSNSTSKSKQISALNTEFEHLKNLLKNYLKDSVENEVGSGKTYEISKEHSIYKMLNNGHNDYEFESQHFITFNYTEKILNQYIFWLRNKYGENNVPNAFHIHGDLVNPDNPIIFGYGDENSTEYKDLEANGDNNFLRNIKTFQYLRSNRYRKILGLLEANDNIYVQIIGHSCGMTDKALLRSIFQHHHVKHIESTYYSNESRYFDNLYNIARIFDDNTLMREKLIPLEETFKIT
jgi:hypothetical protein